MSETLEFKGWLLEQENRVRELRLKLDGLRGAIRGNLSILADVADLNCELAAAQAVEMASVQIDLRDLIATIEAKKKAFGQR